MSDFWTCEECGSKGYCLISATGMRTCANCGWSLRIKTLLQRDEAATRQIEGLKAEIHELECRLQFAPWRPRCECELCKGRIETPKTVAERVDELERQVADILRR